MEEKKINDVRTISSGLNGYTSANNSSVDNDSDWKSYDQLTGMIGKKLDPSEVERCYTGKTILIYNGSKYFVGKLIDVKRDLMAIGFKRRYVFNNPSNPLPVTYDAYEDDVTVYEYKDIDRSLDLKAPNL